MVTRCPRLTGAYIPRNHYRIILFVKHNMINFNIVSDIEYDEYVEVCRTDFN